MTSSVHKLYSVTISHTGHNQSHWSQSHSCFLTLLLWNNVALNRSYISEPIDTGTVLEYFKKKWLIASPRFITASVAPSFF